jgi:hypothetical protein
MAGDPLGLGGFIAADLCIPFQSRYVWSLLPAEHVNFQNQRGHMWSLTTDPPLVVIASPVW